MTTARVAVIEDDADLRETICLMLRFVGHEASGFSSAPDAIERIEDGLPVDVILLDLMMPIMSGWEFCEYRTGSPALASVPVIVITALRSVTTPAGVTQTLEKPFGPDDLKDAIAQALTRSSGSDAP